MEEHKEPAKKRTVEEELKERFKSWVDLYDQKDFTTMATFFHDDHPIRYGKNSCGHDITEGRQEVLQAIQDTQFWFADFDQNDPFIARDLGDGFGLTVAVLDGWLDDKETEVGIARVVMLWRQHEDGQWYQVLSVSSDCSN